MTITVEVEISNKEIASFGKLIATAFALAMEFGRKLVVGALERKDQELAETRDKKRFRCKGRRQTSIKMTKPMPEIVLTTTLFITFEFSGFYRFRSLFSLRLTHTISPIFVSA